jgi:hypothetical protein
MKKIELPKLPKPNFGTVLLVIAALVNVPRWVGLFTMADSTPTWVRDLNLILEYVGGVLMGLTIAGGLAFVTHRLGALQPFTEKGKPIVRFWGALITDILIMVASGILLPPYVRVLMPKILREEISKGLDVWSIVAVLVGDLIIIAIALVDAKSAGFTRSADKKVRSAKKKPAHSSAQRPLSKKEKSLSENLASFSCPHADKGCQVTKLSQNAINAHAAKCPFKLTIDIKPFVETGKGKK